MRRIAVVTDSTAYLPDGVADKHEITVVALHVLIAGRTGIEGEDVRPADVAAALRGFGHRRGEVTTSRPTPEEFAGSYERLAAAGAGGIVSIHLSGELSGTVDSARVAARAARIPVRVIDSRTTAMALGFAVVAAAEAATADADLDEVARAAGAAGERTTALFYVDTLEFLRRGGRIGSASALVGSALAVKPILHVQDGAIALFEKVRTTGRAIARLTDLAGEAAGNGPVDLAVHHLDAPARATELAATLRPRLPGLQTLYVSEVGAVIGAHVGPGMLAVVVHRRG